MRAASIELPEQLEVEVLDVALLAGVLAVLRLAADAHFLAHAVVLVHYVRSKQGCCLLRTAFLGQESIEISTNRVVLFFALGL